MSGELLGQSVVCIGGSAGIGLETARRPYWAIDSTSGSAS